MWRVFTSLIFVCAATQAQAEEVVRVRVTAPTQDVQPGSVVVVTVEFEIADGWHIYSAESQEIGKPTQIELELPPGFTVIDQDWPKPQQFEEDGFTYNGYEKRVSITARVVVGPNAAPGTTAAIVAKSSWLACNKACMPGSATNNLALRVAPPASGSAPGIDAAEGASMWSTLPYYLAMAFLGGMILNLMPCVLPVLSLKVLSFAKQAGEDRGKLRRIGLWYAAGTLATFALLALAVIVLQQLGVAVGWGFQFQHPAFVLALMSLVTVMALSMFGVFHISVNAGNGALGTLSQEAGWKGAFFTGVLSTILSTPCTAPFLGTALGFAFSQPWLVILSILLSVGAGLAAPYVVLCCNPNWLKWLPKRGEWMVRFKESMGFAMLLTSAWLLGVLVAQCGSSAVLPAVLWLTAISFCSWLIGAFAAPHDTPGRRRLVWLLALAIAGSSAWLLLPRALTVAPVTATGNASHKAYSAETLQQHLDAGEVVLLDFTAQWCLTCQVYERTVLASADVQAALAANNAVILRCDWTNGDPAITAKLREFGRSGVPLYVVYSPHRPNSPQVLPDLLTPALVIEALEAARKP